MFTIVINLDLRVSYVASKSHGLDVWVVKYNNTAIATHMSEAGARTHIERLAKKLWV